MTPTHPSHHTTTSHVSSVAVLMWNNVVSVGSERYRQLWYSGYRYQNSRWPFAFHLSHTRHQRVAQIFALPVLQLWPCRQLFWWGVFGSFSFSLFKRLLNMDFYFELQAMFSNFDIFIVFLYGVTGKSDFTWWLVWNLSLRIRLCLFCNFFVEWVCPRMNYRTSKKR